ncbi:hypothetical protein HG717_06905 [Rhodococcus erythropolis]|uniref:hypothetical protein n=1 Tax=Rhodococcus TaxID=1827 RepID=UPI001C70E773|nr:MULTISPECIES: hypothetical protein [Rhodococcus]MBY6383642.1 hypothetical protein [Rhodococcus erythropolis]
MLLSHVPVAHPGDGCPLAAGVPADVELPELRAWLEGRTALDRESRIRWTQDQVERLAIRATHLEDQHRGARAELEDLGELALQEADAEPVIALHERIRNGEWELQQADIALALAEQRLERLQAIEH